MEYKHKLKIKKSMILLLSMILGTEVSYVKELHKCKEESGTIFMVSSDFRQQLYQSHLLNYYNDIYSDDRLIDKYITSGLLNKVKKLNLDMSVNENLKILQECHTLKKLTIKNSEFLTKENINEINKSSVEEVILIFNLNNVNKVREKKFDVSLFKNKKIVIKTIENDELLGLVFINYLENYSDEMLDFDYENYYELNDILDEIITKINLNDLSLEEKIVLISNYIIDKIEYDKDVESFLNLETDKSNNDLYDEYLMKTRYYNKNSISSIITKDGNNIEGICKNYAALFDIICYKANIKTRIVTAKNGSTDLYHGWNVIYVNDIKKYIDLTKVDTNDNLKYLLNKYFEDKNCDDLNVIKDYLFESIYFSHSNYQLDDDLDELDINLKGKIYYFNEGINGEKFYPKVNVINTFDSGLISLFIAYGVIKVYDSITKAKKLKKIKKV